MSQNGELILMVVNARNQSEKLPYVGVVVNGVTKLTNEQGIVSFFPDYPAKIEIRTPMYSPYTSTFSNAGTYTIQLKGALAF
jgi:hypothetical protein